MVCVSCVVIGREKGGVRFSLWTDNADLRPRPRLLLKYQQLDINACQSSREARRKAYQVQRAIQHGMAKGG
jgi:hypothetical protein